MESSERKLRILNNLSGGNSQNPTIFAADPPSIGLFKCNLTDVILKPQIDWKQQHMYKAFNSMNNTKLHLIMEE